MDKNSLQIKVEQSYFYGMAAHIATDCIIHQLVNVYAGAYHVISSHWENQQGNVPINLWSTHNKVEHFWDSYIRFKYFGDMGNLFYQGDTILDKDEWMTKLEFPTTEKYIKTLKKELDKLNSTKNTHSKADDLKQCLLSIEAKTMLIESLSEDKNKIKIEKAFILPRIFCDRVLNEQDTDLNPFLYDIVIHKKTGAYESENVFKGVIKESTSYQFKANGVYNENKKLSYFASESNKTISNVCFNYLNYIVCPDLKYTQKLGWNNFYLTNALKPFIDSAVKTSNKFLQDLNRAVKENAPEDLGCLGLFWNLDTGHGIQVKNIESDTPKEVITQLKFIHITEQVRRANVTDWKDLKKSSNYKYLEEMTSCDYPNPKKEVRAFNTYTGEVFDSYEGRGSQGHKNIFEGSTEKYLDKIRLAPEINTIKTEKNIDTFFKDGKKRKHSVMNVLTNWFKKEDSKSENEIEVDNVKHRLTLTIQTPIAELSQNEPLGFYLHNDDTLKMKESIKQAWSGGQLKNWLKPENTKSKMIDFVETKEKEEEPGRFKRKDGLCLFETQILLNLEKDEDLTRKIAKPNWNNVIEYEKHRPQYSRNYAVGTGRMGVLKAKGTGDFEGKENFDTYSNISPTEQIFFSLYLLIETAEGWFDMLSKETVNVKKLEKIKKIDGVGSVKIVLFYVLNHRGGMQVGECYIDGIKVKVIS
jgi:hypothetical protein